VLAIGASYHVLNQRLDRYYITTVCYKRCCGLYGICMHSPHRFGERLGHIFISEQTGLVYDHRLNESAPSDLTFALTTRHICPVRLQLYAVQNPGQKVPGTIKLLRNMIAKDGPKSVYAGLSASLTRQCTYGTARMGIHRSLSDFLQERNGGTFASPFFTSPGLVFISPQRPFSFPLPNVSSPLKTVKLAALPIEAFFVLICVF
jgi:hypothetical protein